MPKLVIKQQKEQVRTVRILAIWDCLMLSIFLALPIVLIITDPYDTSITEALTSAMLVPIIGLGALLTWVSVLMGMCILAFISHLRHDRGLAITIDTDDKTITVSKDNDYVKIPFEQVKRIECHYPDRLASRRLTLPKCYRLVTKRDEYYYATETTNVEKIIENNLAHYKDRYEYLDNKSFSGWKSLRINIVPENDLRQH